MFTRVLVTISVLALGMGSPAFAQVSPPLHYVPVLEPKDSGMATILDTIRQTNDPLKALLAYSNGLKLDQKNVALHQTYMQRLLDLNQLQMAAGPAAILTRLSPDNGTAWAVLASANAEQGSLPAALTAMGHAAKNGPLPSWAHQLGGQLLAWYHGQNVPLDMSGEDRQLVLDMARNLGLSDAFMKGYGEVSSALDAQKRALAATGAAPAGQGPASPPADAQLYSASSDTGLQQALGELNRQVQDLQTLVAGQQSNALQYSASTPPYQTVPAYGTSDLYYNPAMPWGSVGPWWGSGLGWWGDGGTVVFVRGNDGDGDADDLVTSDGLRHARTAKTLAAASTGGGKSGFVTEKSLINANSMLTASAAGTGGKTSQALAFRSSASVSLSTPPGVSSSLLSAPTLAAPPAPKALTPPSITAPGARGAPVPPVLHAPAGRPAPVAPAISAPAFFSSPARTFSAPAHSAPSAPHFSAPAFSGGGRSMGGRK